jgi:hypothetical protein
VGEVSYADPASCQSCLSRKRAQRAQKSRCNWAQLTIIAPRHEKRESRRSTVSLPGPMPTAGSSWTSPVGLDAVAGAGRPSPTRGCSVPRFFWAFCVSSRPSQIRPRRRRHDRHRLRPGRRLPLTAAPRQPRSACRPSSRSPLFLAGTARILTPAWMVTKMAWHVSSLPFTHSNARCLQSLNRSTFQEANALAGLAAVACPARWETARGAWLLP